jgi:hypothetical protein
MQSCKLVAMSATCKQLLLIVKFLLVMYSKLYIVLFYQDLRVLPSSIHHFVTVSQGTAGGG